MPAEESTVQTPDQQPLVGRFVHLAIVLCMAIGCGMLTREIGGLLTGIAGGLVAAALWLLLYAERDPERNAAARMRIPGRARLILELVLLSAAGAGLWLGWHRAAGETFWTVALIDAAVRYQRVSLLWRSG
jgi:hypothetical protein